MCADVPYAETILGPGEQVTVPNENSPLLGDRQTPESSPQPNTTCRKQCGNLKVFATACMFLLSCVLAGVSITFIVMDATIFDLKNVPPLGAVYIVKDRVVLLGEFDPFYVGQVTSTSDNGNTYLYEKQCRNLTVHNRTVEQSKDLNLTQDQTYPISEQYLVTGSKLNFHFELSSKHNNVDQDCLAVIYVFDNFVHYNNFLQHGIRSSYTNTTCLQNALPTTSRYSLTADQTRYYLVGLYVPDNSVLEFVEFEIIGYELYFHLIQYQPNCIIEPVLQPTCVFKFGRHNYRDSRNNICILGSTHENSSQVTYAAHRSKVLIDAGTVLLTLGTTGLSLSFVIIPIAGLILIYNCRKQTSGF